MSTNSFATTLRPERPDDGPFLLELYASTRQEEMEATGWPASIREGFLKMQCLAQQQGYHRAFPQAEFAVILAEGHAVGRIVIERAEGEIRLVDIAFLPAYRGRGMGTRLIEKLLREAAAARKPVRLSVLKGQRAGRLYQRLGFQKTGEDGLREQMEWRVHRAP